MVGQDSGGDLRDSMIVRNLRVADPRSFFAVFWMLVTEALYALRALSPSWHGISIPTPPEMTVSASPKDCPVAFQ